MIKLTDDIEHFWKFWSVRFGLIAAACASALGAYAAAKAMGVEIVQHVPQWTLDALIYGSMLGTFASVISRGIDQPKLRAGKFDETDQAGT